MARISNRLPENADGEFFVDESCIDCETCRIVAPAVFVRSARTGQSVVARQPGSEAESLRAKMALVACPTSSIGTERKVDIGPGVSAFPDPVAPTVYYCGFASEDSFGASSYLIVRPGGNVLVDSPRAARPLMDRIDAMGGIATMFLSHRDDVADHATYARRFGCTRVMHADDIGASTRTIERRIEGRDCVALAPDLLVVPVPGHTPGSIALLYRNEFLFAGDHVWRAEDSAELEASRSVCWYSWSEQTRSMERLTSLEFEWVLPGHGARMYAPKGEMRRKLEALIGRMKRHGP
jgi:glyoxylase-like metal-dependent hydrolase (beta-lactamase superfamily II)/ferredoxin